jgi:tRNA pseudouridine38-40 synthase
MYTGRIRLTVRYDGAGFAGSQIQPGKRTVAGTLKAGLESLLNQEVHLLFAGRTDSGVHAEGNVCAFDAALPFPAGKLAELLNSRLPEDLRIRESVAASAAFHPRFDASARSYEYCVYRGSDVPLQRSRYSAQYIGPWNAAAIAQAVAALAGRHAFNRFAQGALDPKYCICTLDPVGVTELGAEVRFHFRADRFLRQMIRRLMGALFEVAAGRVCPARLVQAVDGELEFQFKPAPPRGLTLLCVEYKLEEYQDEYNAVLHEGSGGSPVVHR